MSGPILVGQVKVLVQIAYDNHCAPANQPVSRPGGRAEAFERGFHRLGDAMGEPLADVVTRSIACLVAEPCSACAIRLGGDPFGMRAVVGYYQHLAPPRHLVVS